MKRPNPECPRCEGSCVVWDATADDAIVCPLCTGIGRVSPAVARRESITRAILIRDDDEYDRSDVDVVLTKRKFNVD